VVVIVMCLVFCAAIALFESIDEYDFCISTLWFGKRVSFLDFFNS